MTDFATTLANLATTLDRIGVTNADVISTNVYDGVLTLHLRECGVARLVAEHGDEATHTIAEYAPNDVLDSYHHHIDLKGTNGQVRFLWILPAEVSTPAA